MRVADRLSRWLAPQERFEEIVAAAFRKHGPHLVDLGYANAWDGPDAEVIAAMRAALDDCGELHFQYTPYGGATTTRRQIASQLSRRLSCSFNFRDLILTPGAMAAINMALRATCDGGGECLVLTPCWLDYPIYLDHLGIPFRMIPLADDKHLDLDAIRSALGPSTAAVLLSQPGCPTGTVLRGEELTALSTLLHDVSERGGRPVWLIGDEVHRDVTWDGTPVDSVLQHATRSLSLYSFGKALFLQGQRIGYVAVSPRAPEREEMRTRLVRLARAMGYCTPTHLMQRAVRRLLDHEPPLATIAERQRMVREALTGSGYDVTPGEATFFVYARSPIPDDMEFVRRLADRGVLVLPSSLFHEPGRFRISVTARTEALSSSLPLFQSVLA